MVGLTTRKFSMTYSILKSIQSDAISCFLVGFREMAQKTGNKEEGYLTYNYH